MAWKRLSIRSAHGQKGKGEIHMAIEIRIPGTEIRFGLGRKTNERRSRPESRATRLTTYKDAQGNKNRPPAPGNRW